MFRASSLRQTASYAVPIAFSFAVTVDYLDKATTSNVSHAAASIAPNIVAVPESKSFFDGKGFPSKVVVSTSPKTQTPMALAATGMRRKNLYITEVDVYRVGMYVSNDSLCVSKKWNKTDKLAPLSQALIEVPTKNFKTKPDQPKVMMSLRFSRNVSNDTFGDALNDAFSGLDPTSIQAFKDSLKKANASGTIKQGEELSFVWLEDKSLAIAHEGRVSEMINAPDLADRLLDVYLDPRRAVSPELLDTLGANIDVIDAQDLFGY